MLVPAGTALEVQQILSKWCWTEDLILQNLWPHCALEKIYKAILADYDGSAILKDLLSLCLLSLLF